MRTSSAFAGSCGPREPVRGHRTSKAAHVHGRVRTSVVSIVALLALAAVVVLVLFKSLAPPERSVATPGMSGAPAVSSEGSSVGGTLTIAPELTKRIQETAVVFIIARKASGPPFAVKRIPLPRFPLAYRIGPEDVMMAGEAFDGEMRLSARVSQTGSAGPPQSGDLEGEHGAPVRVGARNVDMIIARVR